jgi:hypothetical protein
LLQRNPATAQLLFDRGLGKAEDGIAPSKGLRKPFGIILVAFLQPALGIGAIRDQPILFELTRGKGIGPYPCLGGCDTVVRVASMGADVVGDCNR